MTALVVRSPMAGGYLLPAVHTGGVNVAMADASVHFASNTIDLTTWENLGSRNDGYAVQIP